MSAVLAKSPTRPLKSGGSPAPKAGTEFRPHKSKDLFLRCESKSDFLFALGTELSGLTAASREAVCVKIGKWHPKDLVRLASARQITPKELLVALGRGSKSPTNSQQQICELLKSLGRQSLPTQTGQIKSLIADVKAAPLAPKLSKAEKQTATEICAALEEYYTARLAKAQTVSDAPHRSTGLAEALRDLEWILSEQIPEVVLVDQIWKELKGTKALKDVVLESWQNEASRKNSLANIAGSHERYAALLDNPEKDSLGAMFLSERRDLLGELTVRRGGMPWTRSYSQPSHSIADVRVYVSDLGIKDADAFLNKVTTAAFKSKRSNFLLPYELQLLARRLKREIQKSVEPHGVRVQFPPKADPVFEQGGQIIDLAEAKRLVSTQSAKPTVNRYPLPSQLQNLGRSTAAHPSQVRITSDGRPIVDSLVGHQSGHWQDLDSELPPGERGSWGREGISENVVFCDTNLVKRIRETGGKRLETCLAMKSSTGLAAVQVFSKDNSFVYFHSQSESIRFPLLPNFQVLAGTVETEGGGSVLIEVSPTDPNSRNIIAWHPEIGAQRIVGKAGLEIRRAQFLIKPGSAKVALTLVNNAKTVIEIHDLVSKSRDREVFNHPGSTSPVLYFDQNQKLTLAASYGEGANGSTFVEIHSRGKRQRVDLGALKQVGDFHAAEAFFEGPKRLCIDRLSNNGVQTVFHLAQEESGTWRLESEEQFPMLPAPKFNQVMRINGACLYAVYDKISSSVLLRRDGREVAQIPCQRDEVLGIWQFGSMLHVGVNRSNEIEVRTFDLSESTDTVDTTRLDSLCIQLKALTCPNRQTVSAALQDLHLDHLSNERWNETSKLAATIFDQTAQAMPRATIQDLAVGPHSQAEILSHLKQTLPLLLGETSRGEISQKAIDDFGANPFCDFRRHPYSMIPSGTPGRGPKIELLKLKRPFSGLLVSDVYSKLNPGGVWERGSLEAAPLIGPGKTPVQYELCSAANLAGQNLSLPTPVGASFAGAHTQTDWKLPLLKPILNRYFPDTNNLEAQLSKSGELKLTLPLDADRAHFRFIAPENFLPPMELTSDQYKSFKERVFDPAHGAAAESIPLPGEALKFLTQIETLPPLERAAKIQEWLRKVGLYDHDNHELGNDSITLEPGQRIEQMQARMLELRAKAKSPELAGKLFAGVCSDFAVLGAIMFCRTGLVPGIMTGYAVNGTSVTNKDAHALNIIYWPGAADNLSFFSIDVTPFGGPSIEQAGVDQTPTRLREAAKPEEKSLSEEELKLPKTPIAASSALDVELDSGARSSPPNGARTDDSNNTAVEVGAITSGLEFPILPLAALVQSIRECGSVQVHDWLSKFLEHPATWEGFKYPALRDAATAKDVVSFYLNRLATEFSVSTEQSKECLRAGLESLAERCPAEQSFYRGKLLQLANSLG